MKNGIFFIGGASGSGKSKYAKHLGKTFKIPTIELDKIFNIISNEIEDDKKINITKEISKTMVESLLETEVLAIVEGGWIQPEAADEIKKNYPNNFTAVFYGYPNDTPETRNDLLIQNNSSHYLKNKHNEIKKQITDSLSYKKRSENYDFKFIDTSGFRSDQNELEKTFIDWLKS